MQKISYQVGGEGGSESQSVASSKACAWVPPWRGFAKWNGWQLHQNSGNSYLDMLAGMLPSVGEPCASYLANSHSITSFQFGGLVK